MAEKNLIDRGTSRLPAPGDTSPVLDPLAPFARAASEPWWLPGVVGGSTSGEPAWAAFAREAVAAAPRDVVVADRAYPGLSGFRPIVAPFVEVAEGRLREALADAGAGVDGLVADGRAASSPAAAGPGAGGAVAAGPAAPRPAAAGRAAGSPAVAGPAADGPSPLLADFRRQLTRRLARIAARTLVTELHEARRLGRLSGAGPEERFRDFVALTARRDGLDRIVTGYPVLARLLATSCLNTADAFAELVARLAADRHLLAPAGVFGDRGGCPDGALRTYAGPGALAGVEAGAGDSHRGGRSVMLLRFADGTRLVYKPRPLAAHRHFNSLVEWFGSLPDAPDLRVLRVLDRGEYGWAEFVEERPCASEAETRQFYRRQGALLALLHALDGTDLHHENLIACGPHPVLVDVETLFHPPLGPARSADPAARALHDSVHRVGLLPQLLVGDTTALDMSAIGGGRAASSPIETADWAEAGTDRMRLVRRAGRFTESANRPRLGTEAADPSTYTEALCDGFRAGYTAIHDHRDELLSPDGPLRRFAGDEVRVVPRPTWTYTTLLDESTHPDLMRDATERHRVLSLLRTPLLGVPALSGVEDEEIAELWCGDVPVFATRPDSSELWSGTGRTVAGPVPDGSASGADAPTGLARVEAKVRAMDTVDRQDQERIIRTAMVSTSPRPPHRPGPGGRAPSAATAPEPEQLLSAARSVGDQLVSLAYRHEGRTNWIGLELLGERYWRLTPMAADLAGGYTGPALFLAQLAALTDVSRYAEAAREALAPVPGLLDALHGRADELGALGSGAYAGLGGIAYALTEVGTLLGDPEVLDLAGPAVRLSCAANAAEDGYGVRGGAAGGLVSLLAVYHATGRPQAWWGAVRCADRLAAAPAPDTGGFADGAAGIGWAMLRLAGAGGDARHRSAGLAALRRATALTDAATVHGPAWCEGAAGVALAIADSPAAREDPELSGWLTSRSAELADIAPLADDSLCHGESSLLELLAHSALPALLPDVRAAWVRRAGMLLASADRAGPRCGTPGGVPHPGLLTGLSGIGHGLLRAGFPDRIGSALLLDPSRAP
ncbi:type 2 lanthipeptide synthetase LanM family protein [Streptomyces sp. FL06-04B]|uniref:type 2 lanthipeptide synthetase LanM family protein n=1 Tax=unclassified Streptomyces TaxID=2593676 RepID=UPI0029B6A981|nr:MULTISPECIES: type 2 lanthipeptide synthetase LanM family protein [unclassified Streptomyces]MDX3610090.1 type 2 lanthipeptide synthetase LanM family protein [Streptomyces sp. FL06-04B]MDX3736114.1 type 2 lanthipeptide synthetase LanM family protein [Streptomyces sp. ID01-15D]